MTWVIKNEAIKSNGELLEIRYTLTCRTIIDEKTGECRDSYSILCRTADDEAMLTDITSIPDRAEEIFRLFVDNTVTPIHAFDVIEELI